MNSITKICCFCGSKNLKLLYFNIYHPYKKDHGPFNFYKCNICGSGLTFPAPSPNNLKELYESFSGGLIPSIKKIRDDNPLSIWYNQCIEHALKVYSSTISNDFSWLDVGAGNGDLALIMSSKYPSSQGTAIDFHTVPISLEK